MKLVPDKLIHKKKVALCLLACSVLRLSNVVFLPLGGLCTCGPATNRLWQVLHFAQVALEAEVTKYAWIQFQHTCSCTPPRFPAVLLICTVETHFASASAGHLPCSKKATIQSEGREDWREFLQVRSWHGFSQPMASLKEILATSRLKAASSLQPAGVRSMPGQERISEKWQTLVARGPK